MNKFVEQRLAAAQETSENLNGDPMERDFIEERTSVLKDFQDFLPESHIPELPRRIRETYRSRDN